MLFPLAASIAIVHKAIKLPKITAGDFFRETVVLFGTIIVILGAAALTLWAFSWFVTG